MNLAMFLADKQAYDHAGGGGMGLLVAAAICWLIFGGSKK